MCDKKIKMNTQRIHTVKEKLIFVIVYEFVYIFITFWIEIQIEIQKKYNAITFHIAIQEICHTYSLYDVLLYVMLQEKTLLSANITYIELKTQKFIQHNTCVDYLNTLSVLNKYISD